MVAAAIRAIFSQPDYPRARPFDEIIAMLESQVPRRRRHAHRRRRRLLEFTTLPRSSTGEDVVHQCPRAAQQRDQAPHQRRRHLSNDDAVVRLATAVIAETRRLRPPLPLRSSMNKLYDTDDTPAVPDEINPPKIAT
jgi:hypothetical protein